MRGDEQIDHVLRSLRSMLETRATAHVTVGTDAARAFAAACVAVLRLRRRPSRLWRLRLLGTMQVMAAGVAGLQAALPNVGVTPHQRVCFLPPFRDTPVLTMRYCLPTALGSLLS